MPLRIEGALQLGEQSVEAGFCACLCPVPSELGGSQRPPEVIYAFLKGTGLYIARATGGEPEILAHAPLQVELGVPVLCIFELRSGDTGRPPHACLMLGSEDPK